MFLEPNLDPKAEQSSQGWIEVICGSMFSGKTEELIRRLNRAKIAKQQVAIFKPSIDKRYNVSHVVSHDANAIYSVPVQHSTDILTHITQTQATVVGIDEAQFFDEQIVEVCTQLANKGKRLIVAGLDMDFQGKPFGQMPALMAVAEFITKLHAICVRCGGVASYSYRLIGSEEQVVLGETDVYEARCRNCFHNEASAD
ncbi:thymidine kinase [Eisenibacter elegans]|jgi:thymidine kinase|uniref:thymidine kinase n=1 Tax=Eisenibacter elegans TaxID=997 RepID=UPI000414D284|nr:thymidine kinase [Eisenibacter elegans]